MKSFMTYLLIEPSQIEQFSCHPLAEDCVVVGFALCNVVVQVVCKEIGICIKCGDELWSPDAGN